jgi:DNA (cytosine-5)-methyltransferase 1
VNRRAIGRDDLRLTKMERQEPHKQPTDLGSTGEHVRAFDMFCGAGGSSCGARMAGVEIVGGIDCWPVAADTFKLNFPNAVVWSKRLEQISAVAVAREIGPIDLLLASPECTNHTFAKGNRRIGEQQEESRKTAFHVIRFAKALKPRWLVIENVVSMRRWDAYPEWKSRIAALGYTIAELVLDARDFGVPQSRRRLFILCDRLAEPHVPRPRPTRVKTVLDILYSGPTNGFSYDMTPLFRERRRRAPDTIDRARRAIAALGPDEPFLIVYYGTDAAGGWQPLNRPLRTITTLDRFALVKPTSRGHVMRMLQPPELAKAMGFPDDYVWPEANRRERIKLVGNAVAPPVMQAILKSLLSSAHSMGNVNDGVRQAVFRWVEREERPSWGKDE